MSLFPEGEFRDALIRHRMYIEYIIFAQRSVDSHVHLREALSKLGHPRLLDLYVELFVASRLTKPNENMTGFLEVVQTACSARMAEQGPASVENKRALRALEGDNNLPEEYQFLAGLLLARVTDTYITKDPYTREYIELSNTDLLDMHADWCREAATITSWGGDYSKYRSHSALRDVLEEYILDLMKEGSA